MVGGAQTLLASALEYTKMRVQFGRSIASFQAIKHRLADLHVDVELAKVSAWQAAAALAAGEAVSENASLAKFIAADTYLNTALETIQLHGGIGFTWENDTHLWYRRAKSSEVLLGSPAFHRERMIQEMAS
jgi:alkylation response protein AidB-like acyl-CoA dehydrogenase